MKKEKDDASKKRLVELQAELKSLKEKSDAMTAQWKAEKSALEEVRSVRAKLDEAKNAYEIALTRGDNATAARYKYGVIPEFEKQLKAHEEEMARKGAGALLREEVTADEIAEVVARWSGIPVTKLLEGEREKLIRLADTLHKRVIDRLAFLLVENWCLCRYFQLYNPGNGNFAHYIAVLKACINHLKCLGIRRLVGEERKRDKWLALATMLGEDYELGETDHVVRVIKEAFDSERITDESQRMKVAQDFAENIMGLIDVIAYDSKDVDEYVRDMFMTETAMPVLPKCPEKVASARAFVNRLSSQFDEGKLRVLTPELKDRLLDSFNILQDYGKAASWARREADFASSLLAFIPRACTVSGERKS